MIQQSNNIKCYYNSRFDTLNLYLGKAKEFYSEEDSGIYFIRDESTDELIGIEIMYYSKRSEDFLKKKIPVNFDFNQCVIRE
jgi:hypothetical protein